MLLAGTWTQESMGVEQSQLWLQAFQSVENDVPPLEIGFFFSLYNTETKALSSTHNCALCYFVFTPTIHQLCAVAEGWLSEYCRLNTLSPLHLVSLSRLLPPTYLYELYQESISVWKNLVTEKQNIIAFQTKPILNIVWILCTFTATQKKMV